MKPLIGLTGPSYFTEDCISAIEDLYNFNFVLLYQKKESNITEWLEKIDGLIIAGGIDIHPYVYSSQVYNNGALSKFSLTRDYKEIFLINNCLKRNIPILGICRGHQIIGSYFGMPIVMDISNSPICHNQSKNNITLEKNEPCHAVKIIDCKFYYDEIYDAKACSEVIKKLDFEESYEKLTNSGKFAMGDKIWVNSFHHQGVAHLPKKSFQKEGITILGASSIGVENCDIVEMMVGKNWLSVQWHPEYDWRENPHSLSVLTYFQKIIKHGSQR